MGQAELLEGAEGWEPSPSSEEMENRLGIFCELYAARCEALGDERRRLVPHVGEVSIAAAVRMEKKPARGGRSR